MQIFLMVIGLLTALAGFLQGFVVSPQSAPQQTVQYLAFVVGALGLVLVGLGGVIGAIRGHTKAILAKLSEAPAATE